MFLVLPDILVVAIAFIWAFSVMIRWQTRLPRYVLLAIPLLFFPGFLLWDSLHQGSPTFETSQIFYWFDMLIATVVFYVIFASVFFVWKIIRNTIDYGSN